MVKLAGTPYEPPRPEPSDELDDLLGGALSNLEGEAMTEEVAEAAHDSEAAPAAEGTPEESVAISETDSDAEGDASGEDKKKTEAQTGDAA